MNSELTKADIDKIIKAIEENMKQSSHWEIRIIGNEGTIDTVSSVRRRIKQKMRKDN